MNNLIPYYGIVIVVVKDVGDNIVAAKKKDL
jgi:hypothetical protein